MTAYFTLKLVHVLSATVLFGTGVGTAFFKWTTDRSGDVGAIRIVSERVVLADWLFTTPAAVVQPVTGVALALLLGYPLTSFWLVLTFVLYAAAGICWIRVLWLQVVMRDLAIAAASSGTELDARYALYNREWFWLGIAAFGMFILIFYLMVFRPG